MDRFERQNDSIVQRAGAGIQAYMAQVYGWMTVGLLLTAFVAWYAINNSNIIMYLATHGWVLIGLIIAEFALVIGLSFLLPKLSAGLATAMFMLYSALTGLTISLVLVAYTGASVASTFFITAAMFGALSFYGYTTKRSLSGMGSFLFMALIGLIIASLVNIWLQSSGLTLVITYAGVLIFAGLTAYDTQKLKDMGSQIDSRDQDGMRKYAILGALTLYLDFINLFLMMLRILGDRR
ncbi:Bax inhibitor-1/YccA family protein [Arsenophonus sp. aPb]|uniref:Bax inhibitor-1/YccA family protein n=1 Tax=Arsenophonus sp. aPb TaxID=3041619 RepID=UPI0024689486|nr:Bax inhibitor-1/YccA family protein [Arsenophonus sp. aPb]WGL99414.1 Bax inhibitor-1/YccA family protein [Arsenophonus sp. aPb]